MAAALKGAEELLAESEELLRGARRDLAAARAEEKAALAALPSMVRSGDTARGYAVIWSDGKAQLSTEGYGWDVTLTPEEAHALLDAAEREQGPQDATASKEHQMAAKKKAEKSTKPKKPKAPKGGSIADVKIEHLREQMACELTPGEVIERGNRVMKLLSDKELKQNDVKSATAHLKADIKQIDAEIAKLSKEHVEKRCYREVEVERRYIYRTGRVVDVRMDTNVEIHERAMTGSERQLAPKALNEPAPKPETKAPAAETKPANDETPPASTETPAVEATPEASSAE